MDFKNNEEWITTEILKDVPNYEHYGTIEKEEERESKTGKKFSVLTVDGRNYSQWTLQNADKVNSTFLAGEQVRIFAKKGVTSRLFIEHFVIKTEDIR